MSHPHRWLRANPLPYLLVALVALSGATRANSITVTSTADNTTVGDGQVTLREAIQAANTNLTVDGVTGSAGSDTLDLTSLTGTITLGSDLPALSEAVIITGPGANVLTVQEAAPGGSLFIFTVNSGVSATFSGLTISNGSVGIANFNGGTVIATACTISGNNFAGILNDSGGTLTVSNSTLSGNPTGFTTGNSATATATNCTISGSSNVGISHGGVVTVNLTNCTVSGNNNGIDGTGTLTIKNVICAGNTNQDITPFGTLIQQGNNLTSGNPVLSALGPNGGPTFTMVPQTGSPAIDQGINSAPLTTDQRGQARPNDDPAITNFAGGDGSDIGAVEVLSSVPPCLSISNVTVVEGNSGTINAIFTVSLSAVSSQNVTVNYAVTNGSATAPTDYNAASIFDSDGGTLGTLTIFATQTYGTITVPVNGDLLPELTENFFVDLSSPTNATICDKHGIGTITNDDKLKLFVSDVQMYEGDGGNRAMYFTISLNYPAVSAMTVTCSTAGVTNNSATAGTDYVALSSSSVPFAVNDTSKSVIVNIIGDTTPEADESFILKVTSAPGTVITKGTGYGTIVNDDLPGIPWIANVSLSPGNVTSTVGVEQMFVATYFNSTGYIHLSDCRVRMGTATNDLRYDAVANKLYLWNGSAFTGGFAPGSSNVITGVAGSLSCLHTQVVRSGQYVTVSWALTPNASLNGTFNMRMFCRNNDAPVLTAHLEPKGTWTQ